MGEIQTRVDRKRDLTVQTVSGNVSGDDLILAIREFFAGDKTSHTLWDFRDADLSSLSGETVRRVAAEAFRLTNQIPSGKTAIVAHSDLVFGLGRMFEAFQEISRSSRSHQTFRSMGAALEWIDGK